MPWQWVRIIGSAAFAPRDGAGGVVHRGKMWLLGGWNPGDKTHFPLVCNNEVWSSKDGSAWAVEKSNTFLTGQFDPERDWEGRHTAGYVVFKNRMWIIGGDPIQGTTKTTCGPQRMAGTGSALPARFRGNHVFFTIRWPSRVACGSWGARHYRNLRR